MPTEPRAVPSDLMLLCRVRTWLCALPVATVEETMRPLPVAPLAEGPAFVAGLSIIRGRPTPVVDTAALLGAGQQTSPRRLVVLRLGERRVALAVDEVLGVRALPQVALHQLPPLLSQGSGEAIAAVGALDDALLVALDTGRLLPPTIWDSLTADGATP